MFRAFNSPSSGVYSAAVFVLPLGSCSALLFVCLRLLCGLVRCGDYRVLGSHHNEPVRTADVRKQTTKYYMNQAHKQQLKIPLMMGW